MIPAILLAPAVQGIVGGMVGQVMNCFAPAAPSNSLTSSFNPYLNNATAAASAEPSSLGSASGTMRSSDWGTMSSADTQMWASGLSGKHVDATDNSGRTISGTVGNMQMLGNTLALNIGGHLVSLSQLKQVSWSPAIA